MRREFFVLCLLVLPSVAFCEPELKGSPAEIRGFLYPNDRIVTISGEAEQKAYSDKAIISLVITTESKLLSDAMAGNESLRAQIRKSLVAAGLSQDAIKSSRFSSSPQYGWLGGKLSSYKVVNRMAITIGDESHLKAVAVVADQSKEVELADTVFEHSQKDEFNELAKAKALEKILKQKQFYEKSLGVKLTTVGIRELDIRQTATRGAMMLEEVVVTAARGGKDSVSASGYAGTVSEPSFDEVRYEARLAVDFKIEG